MQKRTKFSIVYYFIAIILLMLLQYLVLRPPVKEISYKEFKDRISHGDVKSVHIGKEKLIVHIKEEIARRDKIPKVVQVVKLPDENLIKELQERGIDYRGVIEDNWFSEFLFNWILPIALLVALWAFLLKRLSPTQNVMTFGKSKAKIYASDEKQKVTFNDVAGLDEVIEEVKEVVDFLKNPRKYQKLGAKIPKGVLLVGPPGTGKTLLAKAIAGEAGVPFFYMSGSDFVEMFVGVGAARVRDLFAQAKQKAPCIIFIDEIDAIGKARSRGVAYGGIDERENTLNQLLVEMDGFESGIGVIIMAATNRPDVLDPALLRPGRFDRQIVLDRPDLNGRIAIFKVHTRNLKLADDVDFKMLAAQTPGFAGAEIANVCNEAALLAARKGKDKIDMSDFREAIERIIAGLEKRNKVINEKEKKVVAYHESGHAIVGYFIPGADQVQKVSIIPRSIGALGYTLKTPTEDRYLLTKEELLGKIAGLLGGRAAEEIVFGQISTGAQDDLQKATEIARHMVITYGMSDKLGNISLVEPSGMDFLSSSPSERSYSEETARMIDAEVRKIIDECYLKAKDVLNKNRDKLDKLANKLLEKEVIEKDELDLLIKDEDKASS
jgi:cell division protease FtsH